jgi:hypothetical protein
MRELGGIEKKRQDFLQLFWNIVWWVKKNPTSLHSQTA